MKLLRFAAKLVGRDFKAGEIWIFILSLLIAITCISSVQMFTDRVQRAMDQEAATLLGGDLVLSSNQPIGDEIRQSAKRAELNTSEIIRFLSMVRTDQNFTLANIKAVDLHYPLRGHLEISDDFLQKAMITNTVPKQGSVWVQGRLLSQMKIKIGDLIKLGDAQLTVTKVLSYEPDHAGSWFELAPRIIMNEKDLDKAHILQLGARASYQLLMTGSPEALAQFESGLKPLLKPGQRLLNAKADRPSLARVLERTNHYLNLTGVIAVSLAGIAIALACQKYIGRHQNTIALMRCFGCNMATIIGVFTAGLCLLSLISIVFGVCLGFGSQYILEALFTGLVNFQLPKTQIIASWPAVVIGVLLVFGFAFPQLLRLRNVSSLRLLRPSQEPLPQQSPLIYGTALSVITAILFWQSGNGALLMILLVAFSISISVMYLLGVLLLNLLGKLSHHFQSTWRMGLLRHRSNSLLHITAFGITFLVILMLGIVRQDLLYSWQAELPENTPNYFLINIASDEVEPIRQFLDQHQVQHQPLYPIIRGRLTERNGKPILQTLNEEQQADNALYRDLNLTYHPESPPGNPIIEGKWWRFDETKHLVSLEEGVATRLGLKIGETIGLNIAGREVSAKIVNLRQVTWTSFKPNFFMIFTPSVLNDFPSTYMTSFYLPKEKVGLLSGLIQQHPNATLLDVADIITNIQKVIDHMSLALTYILVFMILVGLMVLFAGIVANIEQRSHVSAIMRAQGATSQQIRIMLLSEFLSIGLLAGISAAITAIFSSWLVSFVLLGLPSHLSWWPLWVAPLSSALLITTAGYWGSRTVLRSTPMQLLKTFDY
jgi:putative ABC transport system permease protein